MLWTVQNFKTAVLHVMLENVLSLNMHFMLPTDGGPSHT